MRIIHFDLNVIPLLVQRGWNVIAGAVTLLVIPLWLGLIEQGYYYTFLSIAALQIFFELGFNTVIVQFVGHEAAHLHCTDDGSISGNQASLERLQSLIQLLRHWYRIMAVLFFFFIGPAGYLFFNQNGVLGANIWLEAWLTLVLATAVNLYLSPQLAVLEGMGKVPQIARLRMTQSMLGHGAMWLVLACGGGLKAVPLVPVVTALFSWFWLRRYRNLLNFRATTTSGQAISWRHEILPLQWRIALSWISGYFIFNAFTPLVFAHQGAIEAGRIGISLTIFSTITNLGTSWASANVPKMTGLIAHRQRRELNDLFWILFRSSFMFTLVACCSFILAVYGAGQFGSTLGSRISGVSVLIGLTVVALSNAFIFTAAMYIRAHKAEPLLAPSLVGGALNFCGVYYGSLVSTDLTILFYACCTLLVGVPWTIFIFKSYYQRVN